MTDFNQGVAMGATTITRQHQRDRALENANTVRLARAAFKADVRAGHASVASVLTKPPSWVLSMRVFDLLTAIPGVGSTKALRMLRAEDCGATRSVASLTVRQRLAIAEALAGRGPARR